MSKHTPGPWRFDDAGPLSGNIVRFDILAGPDTDPFRVCQIDDSAVDEEADIGNHDRKRAAKRDLANARLIAAAPNMLSALRLMVIEFRRFANDNGPREFALDTALAAIRKAEGEA